MRIVSSTVDDVQLKAFLHACLSRSLQTPTTTVHPVLYHTDLHSFFSWAGSVGFSAVEAVSPPCLTLVIEVILKVQQ